ncbi:MAG: hypothetical protein KAI67_04215 [Candidatus Pacebacteria bacterium]|nr:hypothetical protein [Candidatus Paceibacterota bacterium]
MIFQSKKNWLQTSSRKKHIEIIILLSFHNLERWFHSPERLWNLSANQNYEVEKEREVIIY